MDVVAIDTMAEVIRMGQPAGRVEVIREYGSTAVDLRVSDGESVATVYLTYKMVGQLMVALGAAANEI